MGKYMRKFTTRHEVAVMDGLHLPPSAGVRTRARTLAFQAQRLDCLELRSRCLEKPPQLLKYHKQQWLQSSSRKTTTPERGAAIRENESLHTDCIPENHGLELGPHAEKTNTDGACVESKSGGLEILNSETEDSCGENNLEVFDRSTRESTPCSLIKNPDAVATPGSSTKRRSPATVHRRVQNAFLRNIPTSLEMEEFFSSYEQQEQREFIDKYNFDIVNDLPLPGRFEWVKVFP